MGIDTPSDEFSNINTNQSGPPMSARHKLQPRFLRSNPNTKPNTFHKESARQEWTGPIYLQAHIYKLLSQEAKDALQKYNVEAIQKFKTSRNLNETDIMHNVYSWAFVIKFFWIIARIVKEVINGEVLFVLHPLTHLIKLIWCSQPHDCLEMSWSCCWNFSLDPKKESCSVSPIGVSGMLVEVLMLKL